MSPSQQEQPAHVHRFKFNAERSANTSIVWGKNETNTSSAEKDPNTMDVRIDNDAPEIREKFQSPFVHATIITSCQ
jgi:cytolysin (calcineurin-like family phosphatase)